MTKIHDGLRLTEGVDVFDLNTRLRELLNPVRDRLDARELVRRAVRVIDHADSNGTPRPRLPILRALDEYDEEQCNSDRRRRWHDPHRFSMSLGRDPQTGRVLAVPFYEEREYRDALEGSGLFEEYSYWNNTDQPEHVTDEEWAARGEAWERVWPGHSAPVEHMLSFDLRPERDYSGMLSTVRYGDVPPPLVVEELAALPRADRARSHAGQLCHAALLAAHPERDPIQLFFASRRGNADVVQAVDALLADLTVADLFADEEVNRDVDLTTVSDAVQQWLARREQDES